MIWFLRPENMRCERKQSKYIIYHFLFIKDFIFLVILLLRVLPFYLIFLNLSMPSLHFTAHTKKMSMWQIKSNFLFFMLLHFNCCVIDVNLKRAVSTSDISDTFDHSKLLLKPEEMSFFSSHVLLKYLKCKQHFNWTSLEKNSK